VQCASLLLTRSGHSKAKENFISFEIGAGTRPLFRLPRSADRWSWTVSSTVFAALDQMILGRAGDVTRVVILIGQSDNITGVVG